MDASMLPSALLGDWSAMLGVSIFYYDYVITLGDEVSYIWTQPKTRSSYAFLFTRYLGLLGNIIVTTFLLSSLSPSSCTKYFWLREIVFILNQTLVGVLLALRTYALYGKNVRMLIVIIIIALILLGVAFWSIIGLKGTPEPQILSGCHFGFSTETGIRVAIPWEMLFAYDSMIFALTFFKTYQRRRKEFGSLLLTRIFRDGSVYYIIMLLGHLGNIISFYMANPYLRGSLSTFTSNVSVVMMLRLLLNLREIADVNKTPLVSELQLTMIQLSPLRDVSAIVSASDCP